MKKTVSIILCAALALAVLTACGSPASPAPTAEPVQTAEPTPEPTPEPTAESAPTPEPTPESVTDPLVQMTLEEKVGQLFIIRPDALDLTQTPEQIKERLFPFIEKVQAAHPGVPMIFQKTIYRESRNFNTGSDKSEGRRMEVVDSLMNIAVKKYPDVYFVTATCATAPNHETSVDGTHPSDYGYTLWAESIRKPIMKILKKYGIR